MLHEMTNRFAHSFKRFAQIAVVGFAMAGLTACGGGGSSTPAGTTPSTPTPTPTTPTPPTSEIPITPPPTSAGGACFQSEATGSGPGEFIAGLCTEGGDGACPPDGRRLQQCPRSTSSAYDTISACLGGAGATSDFQYYRATNEIQRAALQIIIDAHRDTCDESQTFRIYR